jgi:CysZ protein
MNGNLLTGARYFLRGFAMIFQPGLRRFVIVPLAANVVLFSLMGWALYQVMVDFYEAAMLSVPEWLQFLSWIITPLLWMIGGTGLRLHLYTSSAAVNVAVSFSSCRKSRRVCYGRISACY